MNKISLLSDVKANKSNANFILIEENVRMRAGKKFVKDDCKIILLTFAPNVFFSKFDKYQFRHVVE